MDFLMMEDWFVFVSFLVFPFMRYFFFFSFRRATKFHKMKNTKFCDAGDGDDDMICLIKI